ncbi:MAG: NAD(P)H-binding protein [Deltaproteobacteria bacterium]|nr:NAD(P)H-binding protein [Deltaproteobacteria bacterium]
MSEKVLIVGANGHLGHVVVETALEMGYQVRAADLKTDRLDSIENPDLEKAQADVTKKETLPPLMDGVVGVISTVLFEVAMQEGVKKVVYVSLLNVEKARKAKVMLAKRAVEQLLEKSNLDYTVFRPSGLFHDFVEVFKPQIMKGQVRGLGNGSLVMQPLSPKDLSRCMVDALKNSKAGREIFNIGGPERFTYHEAISMVARAMGKETKISYSPVWLATTLAYVINWIKPGGFLQPDWIEILTMDSVANLDPIRECFGIKLETIQPYLQTSLAE